MRKFDTTLYVKDKSFNILKCRRVDIATFATLILKLRSMVRNENDGNKIID